MSDNVISMKSVGSILAGLGLILLVGQYSGIRPWSGGMPWPLFIIVPGAILLALASLDETFSRALTPVGMMVTLTGCVLAYQNWADHYQSWAYAWIIVGPFSLGSGVVVHGRRYGDSQLVRRGMQLAAFSTLFFLAAAAIFELVFNISGYGLSANLPWGVMTPIVLIAIGSALFLSKTHAVKSQCRTTQPITPKPHL